MSALSRLFSRLFGSRKVTDIRSYQKKAQSGQRCSLCKKRAARLTFYADGSGKVIGACRDCKANVEKVGFLPL
ncbi:hypothetical protein J31TS4_16770 [Paenibacillus sp. J31TS4]|uniref:hypothetical protein n=1 Tax=Paenibacillus sp. J31TS4 TaxID=2807195 RepID=UPI001AFDBBB5|nr:hypothetical protein [Paenibacillus sp. J31TS4]GIP38397.1 hypothetical protein J31TS4_16770 [Paenibacillus sp. J31TS4]